MSGSLCHGQDSASAPSSCRLQSGTGRGSLLAPSSQSPIMECCAASRRGRSSMPKIVHAEMAASPSALRAAAPCAGVMAMLRCLSEPVLCAMLILHSDRSINQSIRTAEKGDRRTLPEKIAPPRSAAVKPTTSALSATLSYEWSCSCRPLLGNGR